jgi:hypothetical protein
MLLTVAEVLDITVLVGDRQRFTIVIVKEKVPVVAPVFAACTSIV